MWKEKFGVKTDPLPLSQKIPFWEQFWDFLGHFDPLRLFSLQLAEKKKERNDRSFLPFYIATGQLDGRRDKQVEDKWTGE